MKKIVAITLMFTACSFAGWSQKDAFSISGHFQYDRSFSNTISMPWLTNNETNGILPGGCVEPMVVYKRPFTFTAGAAVNYRLNSEVEFFGGINYSRKTGYYPSIWHMHGDPLGHPVHFGYYPMYTQNFLEVPIGARFYMLPGNFKMHVELAEITSIPMVFSKLFPEENILIAGRFGYGIDYFLGPWQWSLNVNYGRVFQPVQRNSHTIWDKNNLGIELRTAFRLGKD